MLCQVGRVEALAEPMPILVQTMRLLLGQVIVDRVNQLAFLFLPAKYKTKLAFGIYPSIDYIGSQTKPLDAPVLPRDYSFLR